MKIGTPIQKSQDAVTQGIQNKVDNLRKKMQTVSSNINFSQEEKNAKLKALQHEVDVLNQKVTVRQSQDTKKEQQNVAFKDDLTNYMSFQEIFDEKMEILKTNSKR